MGKEKLSKDVILLIGPVFLGMSHSKEKVDLVGTYKLFFGHLNLAENDKNRVLKTSHDRRRPKNTILSFAGLRVCNGLCHAALEAA